MKYICKTHKRNNNKVLILFRYLEMFLVDKMKLDEDVEWIKFGRMGFEEGVLLIGKSILLNAYPAILRHCEWRTLC
jgi:hypothetical protein